MSVVSRELRHLLRKEWTQLTRSKSALASALLFPVLFLLVLPAAQMVGVAAMQGAPNQLPANMPLPPALQEIQRDPSAIVAVLLPLFVAMGGLILPSLSAIHSLIMERETRSLELMVALPVTVGQILAAKLIAIVILSSIGTVGFVLVDGFLLLTLGLGSLALAAGLLVELVAALAYSTASALLVGLLAKDFRTANNINAALFVPTVFMTFGLVAFVRGAMAPLVIAAVMLLGAAISTVISFRVITFERLLR